MTDRTKEEEGQEDGGVISNAGSTRRKRRECKEVKDKQKGKRRRTAWGFRGVFSFSSFGECFRGVFGDGAPTRERLALLWQQVAAGCGAARLWDLIIYGTETFPRLKDK